MILAEVPPFLTDAAGIITATTVIVSSFVLFSRLRPMKWVWRNLVSDPLGEWGSRWFRAGAENWHRERIEPRLAKIEEGVDVATAWGQVLAERQGIPPNVDPRTLRAQNRTEATETH